MRVGFTLIGGRDWTGGYNYLLNLVRVLHGHRDCGVEPVLFVGSDVPDEQVAELAPLLTQPPIRSQAFERRHSSLRLARACTLGNVPAATAEFQRAGIDVVFEAAQFYGWRFPLATLAWTPDFQHHHLPHMFARRQWWRREIGYRAQVAAGRILMLSSEDARADSERFYPSSRGRTVVVRFAVQPPRIAAPPGPELLARHGLPGRFMYLPNQFWKHKNHAVVIEALALLKSRGEPLLVAASGNPHDMRHVDHYRRLHERVRELGIEEEFRFLGMLPYADVVGLTTLCHALVNPSFFEGWSTTVEEAKALGAPLVLSGIGVHREQAGDHALYFDPDSPSSAAEALLTAWRRDDLPGPDVRRQQAAARSEARVREFALAFANAARTALERRRPLPPRPAMAAPVAAGVPAAAPASDAPVAATPARPRMKVLLVHNFYRSVTPGGEDNVFRQERDMLQAAGLDVVCYTKSNDDVDEHDKVQVLRTAAAMPWSERTYEELGELVRRERPDVAHFHNTFPLITPSAYAACQDHGVPVVQTLHNYRLICCAGTFFREGKVCEICTAGKPWAGVRHRCYRGSLAGSMAVAWMLRRNWDRGTYEQLVDVYVALSAFARDRFASEGLPRDQIEIKPNFVDSVGPASPGGGGYVVFAARLSEEKGVRTLLDAWRELRDVPLKVVGDGPALAEMKACAEAERLPVEFLGMRPRDEVLEIIGRADLQVITSECFEGFPLVLVESYARGTPVIASKIGSLGELVLPGVTGFHFDAGNAASLASQVRQLWADPQTLRGLRVGARARFESEYTPARNLAKLLKIYDRAVRKTAAAAVAIRAA
jgi:glycosyltransferase involved in cell wall biosynthesis